MARFGSSGRIPFNFGTVFDGLSNFGTVFDELFNFGTVFDGLFND